MNCEQFENQLLDSDDGVSCTPPMEAHRRDCAACAEMFLDLTRIREEAGMLRTMHLSEPPPRLWANVRAQLRQEGLIREPQAERTPFFAPAFGWLSRLRTGMAYSAVFAVALSVVYVYSVVTPQVPAPQLNPKLAALPAPPIAPFNDLIDKVPPAQRAVYVSNLNQVDNSIQELSTFLASHPDDSFAREELFTTYQQKSRLWEDLVRWQEFPAETTVP